MTTRRPLRAIILALITVTTLALPTSAAAAGPPDAGPVGLLARTEAWLRAALAPLGGLVSTSAASEGDSGLWIDPDGAAAPASPEDEPGATPDPTGNEAEGDSGPWIDPDGRS